MASSPQDCTTYSTMTDTIDLALGLNAQAVTLLQNEDFHLAIENIRTALDRLRRITAETSLKQQWSSEFEEQSSRLCVAPSEPDRLQRGGPYRRLVDSGDVLVGQGFVAYMPVGPSSAFLQLQQAPILSLRDTSLVTAVLLFNLALSYHLRGLHDTACATRGSSLRMALNLYQHATRLVSGDEWLWIRTDPQVALLLVAIGNNCCSVASSLGRLAELRVALEWTRVQSRNVPEYIPFFWVNVTFWEKLDKNPAPAA